MTATERAPAVRQFTLYTGIVKGAKENKTADQVAEALGMKKNSFNTAKTKMKDFLVGWVTSLAIQYLLEQNEEMTDEQAAEQVAKAMESYDHTKAGQTICGLENVPYLPALKDGRGSRSLPGGAESAEQVNEALALLASLSGKGKTEETGESEAETPAETPETSEVAETPQPTETSETSPTS